MSDDGDQDLVDAQNYVDGIIDESLDPLPCTDANGDGDITVTDAALIDHCHHAHLSGDSVLVDQQCHFPSPEIINIYDSVTFMIGAFDDLASTLDIWIRNPNHATLGYELIMSGIEITGVENLVDPLDYPITPAFAASGTRIVGLSHEDSTIHRLSAFQPLCRVHFDQTDMIICIDSVVDVVNEDLLAVMSDQYNFILPKESIAKGKDAYTTAADVIGSGPYELTEFVAAQNFTMKRRADGYWKPNTAWFDGYEYIHQKDPQQALNALRANQTDAIGTTADLAKTIESDKNFVITRAPTPTRECLLINHTKDRYKDPKVRLALWRAINRKRVYDTVFDGLGFVGGPMTPAAPNWALPDADLLKLPGFGGKMKSDYELKSIGEYLYRSVELKNKFVKKDPSEKNIRKALNFGHTIGHAVEALFYWEPMMSCCMGKQ